MAGQYKLYGGDISYYTGKARAYLRFKKVDFVEIHAGRKEYKEVILPRVGWPVIPILITPEDETLQDTSDIIDELEARHPQPSVYPIGPRQRVASFLLEVFGDEWLKLPAMHYRWNHNTEWIIAQFGALSRPDLDLEGQRQAGEQACKPFRGSLPALGVTEATSAAVEASYEGLMAELDAHFQRYPYLFGDRPSIGDFGLFGPLYAHQYRDPASGALMQKLAPNLVDWVLRMHEGAPGAGDFLPNDEVPETIIPVLARMMREQLPVLRSTFRALAEWLDANPDIREIPRGIGQHAFTIAHDTPAQASGERVIFPFDQWMWQRPYDCFTQLPVDDQARVREMLEQAGAGDALDTPLEHRVVRRNFKLERL
ncbi:MAG: glutathione S-transferase [Pseudomonadaceae bacterium]|nr:glutathione S-transferase [Pseudomonadaceae bacterium]